MSGSQHVITEERQKLWKLHSRKADSKAGNGNENPKPYNQTQQGPQAIFQVDGIDEDGPIGRLNAEVRKDGYVIKEGDYILACNDRPVRSAADLERIIKAAHREQKDAHIKQEVLMREGKSKSANGPFRTRVRVSLDMVEKATQVRRDVALNLDYDAFLAASRK